MHTFQLKLAGQPNRSQLLLDGALLDRVTRVEVVAERRECVVTITRIASGSEDTVELAGRLLDETDWVALQDLLRFLEGHTLSPDRLIEVSQRLRGLKSVTQVKLETEVVA